MTPLNELKALAEAADGMTGMAFNKENAAFVAAANPATILALVKLVEQMRDALNGFIGKSSEYPYTEAGKALAAYEAFDKGEV